MLVYTGNSSLHPVSWRHKQFGHKLLISALFPLSRRLSGTSFFLKIDHLTFLLLLCALKENLFWEIVFQRNLIRHYEGARGGGPGKGVWVGSAPSPLLVYPPLHQITISAIAAHMKNVNAQPCAHLSKKACTFLHYWRIPRGSSQFTLDIWHWHRQVR